MKQKVFGLISFLCCAVLLMGMVPSVSAKAKFKDISASAWYAAAVDFCVKQNYMDGVGGGKFAPNTKVSRAMLATVLHRISGSKVKFKDASFRDVKKGQWYFDGVEYCAKMGIVTGYGNGYFGPNDLLTRQDMVTMFYRFAVKTNRAETASRKLLTTYTDHKKVSTYAREGINWALNSGVMDGISYTEIAPKGTATRAQLAQVLMNYGERILEIDNSAYYVSPDNPYGISVRNVRLHGEQLDFRLCVPKLNKNMRMEVSYYVDGLLCENDIVRFVSIGQDYLYSGDAAKLCHSGNFPLGSYLPTRVQIKLFAEEQCILTHKLSFGKQLQLNSQKIDLYFKGASGLDSRILLYHEFTEQEPLPSQYGVITTPQRFETDIQYLLAEGYTFISLTDLYAFHQGNRALPKKTVILTFDDGYESNYTLIYPILKKYEIPATIFVVVSAMGNPGKLTWEQMLEMEQSGLVDIQSHSWKHEDHSALSADVLNEYMWNAMDHLDAQLGKRKIPMFAYPGGRYTTLSQNIALSHGIAMQMTTEWRALDVNNLDLTALPRLTVSHASDLKSLMKVKSK